MPIVFMPPAIAQAAILVTIELNKKCGYFPRMVRLKKSLADLQPKHILAEVINLELAKAKKGVL